MLLTWLGHSCFRVEAGGSSLVLDPYEDGSVPGLAPLDVEADAVYCSHEHRDHGASGKVRLSGKPCALTVEVVDCFHDDRQGALRGRNRIHLISDGVQHIAHLGDLGHIPDEATLARLTGLDALLIPVGGYYTIDANTAERLCERLSPRVVVPMHYRLGGMGYEVLSTLDSFTRLRTDVVRYDTDRLTLTPDTPRQTAVLRYLG